MYFLFFFFTLVAIVTVPIHFISVEHTKLQERYGKEKGNRLGEIYGRISGDLLFFSLIGLWFSPQPRFTIPILQNLHFMVPIVNFAIPIIHLIICIPFVLFGVFILSQSVSGLSRKVSESHRPEKVIISGIYARVRHPQYLGFLLLHIGFSILLSGWYSLLSTAAIFIMLYILARKEETELTKEFGKDYEEYKKMVPMLILRIRK